MGDIRVLIIDDAVAVRRLLADGLGRVPGLEVVGSAANGRIGLAMTSTVRPDVVVLDLEMPGMDGFEVLRSLRAAHPKLPVIVFSVATLRGSAATLDALALGAADYVTKPSSLDGAGGTPRLIAEELSAKLKALGATRQAASIGDSAPSVAPGRPFRRPSIVVIGVSTGGPEALTTLLPALPETFPIPIVIVQHMPAAFTPLLASRLDSRSALQVAEAVEGQVVRPGQAVIAPGGRHLVACRRGFEVIVSTHRGPPENSCRPAVDVLFRSSAQHFADGTLAIVMTGMGQDGLLGAEEIRRVGGQVLVQDRETSVIWGMPGYVARAGLADRILPLNELAAEIVARAEPAPQRHRPPS